MIQKQASRLLELGKQTTFALCGRPIDQDELVRRSGTTTVNSIAVPQSATTPRGITYSTPPNAEPILQSEADAWWLKGQPGVYLNESHQLMGGEVPSEYLDIPVDLDNYESGSWMLEIMDWE